MSAKMIMIMKAICYDLILTYLAWFNDSHLDYLTPLDSQTCLSLITGKNSQTQLWGLASWIYQGSSFISRIFQQGIFTVQQWRLRQNSCWTNQLRACCHVMSSLCPWVTNIPDRMQPQFLLNKVTILSIL